MQAYEDVQAKERALEQSQQLLADNKKQLEIGSMAPLDVVNAESSVAADQQALISSQSALNYQQQIIKQAIARNLNDAALSAAPVIPTDRVSLEAIPEESQPVEALVQEAFQRRPELEQAVLTLRNDEITLKGARNALLPTLDAYGFYGSSALGGAQSPDAFNFFATARRRAALACAQGRVKQTACALSPGTFPTVGYGTVVQNLFNSSAPDKGVGFNLTIPIRNRYAQSVQERSLMEYRQAELRLEQLHTQIRMQVVNAMYALTNDRAQVRAALAARDYAQQSLDAEENEAAPGSLHHRQRAAAAAQPGHGRKQSDRRPRRLRERPRRPLPDTGFNPAALRDQSAGSGDGRCDDGAGGSRSGTGQARQRANDDAARRSGAASAAGPVASRAQDKMARLHAGPFFLIDEQAVDGSRLALPLGHGSSKSKNSGKLIAADSAPWISVSPSALSAATLKAIAMR